jgi:hypothetical protein
MLSKTLVYSIEVLQYTCKEQTKYKIGISFQAISITYDAEIQD